MKRPSKWFIAILAVVLLLAGSGVVLAAVTPNNHPTPVIMKGDSGSQVNATTPYSPKQTCAGCHVAGCTTPAIPTNTKGWCETDAQKSALGSFADYGSGIKHSTHTQGVIESDNNVYWQSYDTTSFEHGASVGRHSEQGRNEDYNTAMRTAFGDPFFTSAPGMFGKY